MTQSGIEHVTFRLVEQCFPIVRVIRLSIDQESDSILKTQPTVIKQPNRCNNNTFY